MIVDAKKKSYQVLYDELRRRIEERELLPGMALPSENALAADYSISRPTVRRALEMLEKDSCIVRRAGIGSFVNSKDKNGNGEKTAKRLTIGVDTYGVGAEFYTGLIVSGLKRGIGQCGGRLTLVEKGDINAARSEIDGLVLATAGPEDFSFYADLAASGLPVVMINRFPPQQELAYLAVDYTIEATKAIDYLLLLGHRNIAVIGSSNDNMATGERTRGWAQAFRKRGLTPPEELCFPFSEMWNRNDNLLRFFERRRVSAIFVTLGSLMPAVLQEVGRAGLRVPDDLSLICFDDMEETLQYVGTPVSYVRMPLVAMGMRAVEYLAKRHADPSYPVMRQLMEASLVVNSACRPVNN